MVSLSIPSNEIEYYLLILTRMASFIMVAPFFSLGNTPRRLRAALAVFVSFVIYTGMLYRPELRYASMMEYMEIVVKESIIGLMIGLVCNFTTSLTNFAGRLIDMNIGLSMASMFDPTTRDQTTITGVLYQNAFSLILIISGMYRYLLQALFDTYTLIPVGGVVFDTDRLINSIIRFMNNFVVVGFRIALPVFVVIILVNSILGVMAKVASQMNMFAVGIQIKLLVGLTVIFLTIGFMPMAADFIFNQMKILITDVVSAMTPV